MAIPSAALCLDLAGFVVALICLARLRKNKPAHAPLPPGPKGLPIIGNLLDIPAASPWKKYNEWGQEYGRIMSLNLLGRTMVILNSEEATKGMFEAKGAIYSNRYTTPMVTLSSWSDFLTGIAPGPEFREMRKHLHKLFGTPSNINRFSSALEAETSSFLRRVSHSPQELRSHIQQNAIGFILKISHGYSLKGPDDPFIHFAELLDQDVSAVYSFGWMVDHIPALQKLPEGFPGTGFRKFARGASERLHNFVNAPYRFTKEQMLMGIATPSFTSTMIEGRELTPDEERIIAWTGGAIYAGGADTTVSIVNGFFLAMALYPDVFAKAQAEIDSVIGEHRLPSLADRPNLPYISALVLEALRWNIVLPTAVPRTSLEDDIYDGYFIPKDSIIVPNIYFMLRNPETYKDPETFNPGRFLGENPEKDPREVVYGFGKRICPGRHLADASLFVVFAMSVAVLNIQKKTKNGAVIEPVNRMTPVSPSHPEPYEISVQPRSAEALTLISGDPEI